MVRSCPVAHLEILAAEGEEASGARACGHPGCGHAEVRGGRSDMGQQPHAALVHKAAHDPAFLILGGWGQRQPAGSSALAETRGINPKAEHPERAVLRTDS